MMPLGVHSHASRQTVSSTKEGRGRVVDSLSENNRRDR